jgi:hypothetical protein
MYTISKYGMKRLQNVWKMAGKQEAPGCLLFEKVSDNNFASDGDVIQDYARNSRVSIPFPCEESSTSLEWHSHPPDKRNSDANDIFFFSPPSGNDLMLRVLFNATSANHKKLPSLVLAEEGVYVVKVTQRLPVQVLKHLDMLKQSNLGVIDYIIFLARQQGKLSTFLNSSVNLVTEAIARLPINAARDAIFIQAIPSVNKILEPLINSLESSPSATQYGIAANKFGLSVHLHPYGREASFSIFSNKGEGDSEEFDENMLNLISYLMHDLSSNTILTNLSFMALQIANETKKVLPPKKSISFKIQPDVSLRKELLGNPNIRALNYKGQNNLILRLVDGEEDEVTPANSFKILDDDHEEGIMIKMVVPQSQKHFEESIRERPPIPSLSLHALPNEVNIFLHGNIEEGIGKKGNITQVQRESSFQPSNKAYKTIPIII